MSSNDIRETASDWVRDRKAEQVAAHDGQVLRAAARACTEQLPEGAVTLLTTSAEGVALAGAIVALRPFSTSWRQVSLQARLPVEGHVAVVEMVRLGAGLREALQARYPEAHILDGWAARSDVTAGSPLRSAA